MNKELAALRRTVEKLSEQLKQGYRKVEIQEGISEGLGNLVKESVPRGLLVEAATLLESCRGFFAYQSAQGDKFAPDAEWEKPLVEFLEKLKARGLV